MLNMVTRKFIYYTRRKVMRKNMNEKEQRYYWQQMTVSVTACGGGKHQMLHLMQT